MAYVRVRVTPSAREDRLMGWQGDVLRIRVRAAPERGQASKAALDLLARALGLPTRQLRIVRGATSRDKLVFVDRLTEEEVRRLLA